MRMKYVSVWTYFSISAAATLRFSYVLSHNVFAHASLNGAYGDDSMFLLMGGFYQLQCFSETKYIFKYTYHLVVEMNNNSHE